MVLPPSEAAMRQQNRRLDRLHKRSSTLEYEFTKLEAKHEAKKAAEHALSFVLNGTHNHNASNSGKAPSVSSRHHHHQDGNESILSAEVAIQRGSIRGLTEMNESPTHHHHHAHSMTRNEFHRGGQDFDLTTVTEASEDSSKRRKFMRIFKLKRKKSGSSSSSHNHARRRMRARTSTNEMSLLSKEISKEAWMCGCCGKVFSTYEAADYHERRCIQGVIDKLDETKENALFNSQATRRGSAQTMSSDFQAARIAFLDDTNNPRSSSVSSPLGASQNLVSDDLLDDIGLGESSNNDSSARPLLDNSESIYASARSFSMTNLALQDGSRPSSSTRESPGIQQIGGPGRSSLISPLMQGPKRRLTTTFNFEPVNDDPVDVLLTSRMRHQLIMTDEALVNSVHRAAEVLLSPAELTAEGHISCIARDKTYYDDMTRRASNLKAHPFTKFRTDGKTVVSQLQNKFVDAYQLIKQGDTEKDAFRDQYEKRNKDDDRLDLVHDDTTMYINVMVKHSVQVVSTELERLAQQRWEDDHGETRESYDNFEHFRKFAHVNLIRLAKLALSADFTPRKVAVQLSNDLYRLMAPQLKRRGVKIETEIEYRVGPYFVLAVNIKSIDFTKLIKYSHRLVAKRKKEWEENQERRDELQKDLAHVDDGATKESQGVFHWVSKVWSLTRIEFLAQFLAWMYYFHWIIHVPICWLVSLFSRTTIRKYILSTVADEVFSYVEEKGMEMEIGIIEPYKQAAFMLSALREIREGTKKGKNETGDDKGEVVGPLLGPAIKADKGPAPPAPDDIPENLAFVNFEAELPVGFRRLRWAMLATESAFSKDALFPEGKLENTSLGEWNRHDSLIGKPTLPDTVTDIVGAERESSYLMPKSAFVKANMNYETQQITAYNDYCFCIKKRTRSPEVPYGSAFVTWTQQLIVNTGNDSCKVICSVEPEFPNGPPMISRQIQSGMRAGTAESFALMAEVIIKYADEFP